MSYILGISAYYHDAAAAILHNGRILAAAQEERFTRRKHDPSFPTHAIRYCLDEAGCSLDDLSAIAFYDKPMLKFERLLETAYHVAPRGLRSFVQAMPIWIREKLFLKRTLRRELAQIQSFDSKRIPLFFPAHHLSHAASAFYPSRFERAAILTIDGVGEWATASIALGEGKQITTLRELHFPHSVGLLYSAFTYYLGFRVNSGEYKLMGLAPYGNPEHGTVAHFKTLIKTHLVDIRPDGSIRLDQTYFAYTTGNRMTHDTRWERLFGFPRREPESDLTQQHCDLALAIQQVTEEIVLNLAREAKRLTGAKSLCMAGGVALNCVANGKIQQAGIFDHLFTQPSAGDAGGALGAALAIHHLVHEAPRDTGEGPDQMQGAYLGPAYSEQAIERALRHSKGIWAYYPSFGKLCEVLAAALAEGKAIGWFQGRMEFGPRALGNRSILGDPRDPEMQARLNLKIKMRESFRPFAPSVLAEKVADWFATDQPSPYMLQVHPVHPYRQLKLPTDYHSRSLREKLYTLRSEVPAITHIDHSARIQTVHAETNPRYYRLIKTFFQQTGCPLLVNTSFNVRGEPIVCTPEDAIHCFFHTDL
ncbi:MAG: carbamoyltransferase, partial [Bacteroidota bacterium]